MKDAYKIVPIAILLMILIVLGFVIFVYIKYGGKPITELPAWAVKFFITR